MLSDDLNAIVHKTINLIQMKVMLLNSNSAEPICTVQTSKDSLFNGLAICNTLCFMSVLLARAKIMSINLLEAPVVGHHYKHS